MMVAGVVKSMSGESAERAALGAGSIVMDVMASNDGRLPYEKIKRIRDRLKNNEIKNNLNAAIRAGQIKTTKGKVMQKQYTYKFLTGPEKAQLINKAKNN